MSETHELVVALPKRGRKFRDAAGRFRRKRRDDMDVLERMMDAAASDLAKKLIDDGYFGPNRDILSPRVSGFRIRLPE